MNPMNLLKVTTTPEQQTATQARIAEAFGPLINQIRVAAPLMAQAAAKIEENLRRTAARP